MSTARDYLVSKGLAKPGRGKFSNAAKDELARALSAGTKFSDWPKNATGPVARPTKSSGESKAAPVKASPTESLYISPSDFRFPEDEYVAKGPNGEKYSMRECCNTCRVSLTNHACASPSVYDNIAVSIVRR